MKILTMTFTSVLTVPELGYIMLAVVLVGLLCILLLSVTIGLCAKGTADRHEWVMENSKLKTEKEELLTNLTIENNQMHHQHDQLKLLHAELQKDYNTTDKTNSHLLLRLCKLEMDIKENAVDVTLDIDTAGPYLIVSADRKQVKVGLSPQARPDNPKRFEGLNILGKQGFSTGRLYYEVQVKGKTKWDLGVTSNYSNRKGQILLNPKHGYWTIWLRSNNSYQALDGAPSSIIPINRLERVGVFVDYEARLVSFYNAEHWNLLYSFKHVNFNGTIYPFFSPSGYTGNSAPLIITTPISCIDQYSNK